MQLSACVRLTTPLFSTLLDTPLCLWFPLQDKAVSVLQQELASKLEGGPTPVDLQVAKRRAIRKGARCVWGPGTDTHVAACSVLGGRTGLDTGACKL